MEILDYFERNRYVKFVKDNYALVIAIPYIIGGLRQFVKLTSISMDLVIYFSLTQLFIDGLITIFKLIFFLSIISLAYNFVKDFRISNERKKVILRNIPFFVLMLALTFSFILYIKINYSELNIKDLKLFISYSILTLFFTILFSYAKDEGINYMLYLTVIFTVSLTPIPMKQVHIYNIDKLTNDLQKRHRSIHLSYYNDQFLFYETNLGKPDNKIVIKKMDDIFEPENTSNLK